MTFSCDVEIRTFPEGNVIRRDRVPGLVQACAFNRPGDRLAYAGGHAQSIFIHDLTRPDDPPLELKGQGSTPYSLGFTEDGQTVGFGRGEVNPANPPGAVEAFDLGRRKVRRLPREPAPRGRSPRSGAGAWRGASSRTGSRR